MGPRNAVLGVADACGHANWELGWSSPWGHETLFWVWRTHVATPTGAAGGTPYGATKRCTACGGCMWPSPLGPW
eukprot:1415443-Pyramimonas_sp.AAC.1